MAGNREGPTPLLRPAPGAGRSRRGGSASPALKRGAIEFAPIISAALKRGAIECIHGPGQERVSPVAKRRAIEFAPVIFPG